MHGLSQPFEASGIKIGLLYEVGQPVHRLGLNVGFHINQSVFQFTTNNAVFYAFKNYGPSGSRWEIQTGVSLGVGFGSNIKSTENLALLSPVSNYSNRRNMLSYGVKYYYDKIYTKQFTGSVQLRLGDYFLATENDGFVFLPFDKYRTGALSFGKYYYTLKESNEAFSQHLMALSVLLYTGQTQGPPTEKVNNKQYPARFGYKKLNDSKYSDVSHGILQANITTSLPYNQSAFASMGIDHEPIRNFLQNKVIHDLPFLPKRWIKIKNPHIPMRNTQGKDYLYRKNEMVKKGKMVWGIGSNRPLFY